MNMSTSYQAGDTTDCHEAKLMILALLASFGILKNYSISQILAYQYNQKSNSDIEFNTNTFSVY